MPKLAVLLTDAFADWEAAPLMAAARGYLGVEIVTVSPGGTPVTSMGGLRVTTDMALEALTPEDIDGIAIIGGMIWETDAAPDLGPVVLAFRRANRAVGGICAGTLAIARTGILRGVTHTSNARAFLEQSEHYHGQSSYMNVPFAVRDGLLVTASGMSPVSFAREMLVALGAMTHDASDYFARFADEHCPEAYRKAS